MKTKKEMKHLWGIVERGEGDERESYWTRIGVAFQNSDGSWNQLLDYYPADGAKTRIQMRDPKPRERREEG